MTDSGGIKEEATDPSINKSAFVLRTSTEKPEAVESGHSTVVGVSPDTFPKMIAAATEKGLEKQRKCPYGNGNASRKIVDAIS